MSIAVCPNCHSKIEAPYWKIGLSLSCLTCGACFSFKGEVVHELDICGKSGNECTFLDFTQVLKTYMDVKSAQKIIAESLNLVAINKDNEILFETVEGELVENEMVHKSVQLNSISRGLFYQYAMSRWR